MPRKTTNFLLLLLVANMLVIGNCQQKQNGKESNRYYLPPVSQFQLPQFQVPQYQVPQYQVPQYQVPQYQAPQYQAPQYQAPQFQVPQYQVPQFQVPQYQVPQFQFPQYQVPQFPQIPQIPQFPQISTPTYEQVLGATADIVNNKAQETLHLPSSQGQSSKAKD